MPLASWGLRKQRDYAARNANERIVESLAGTFVLASPNSIQLADLQSKKVAHLEVPNLAAHAVSFSKANPELCVIVDQNGPTATVFHLRDRKKVAKISAREGFALSGHAVFSPDGAYLYLAEFPKNFDGIGVVTVLNTKTWQEEARFSSGSAQTHEIVPIRGGSVLAVGHYGERVKKSPFRGGALAFMEASTGKILQTIHAPDDFHSLCHLDKTDDDELVVATRSWKAIGMRPDGQHIETHYPTPMAFGSMGEKAWKYSFPESIAADLRLNLSVRVDSSRRRALVTHLDGKMFTAWALDGSLLGKKTMPGSPLGVAISTDKNFYLVTNRSGELDILDGNSLATVKSFSMVDLKLMPSSHCQMLPERLLSV